MTLLNPYTTDFSAFNRFQKIHLDFIVEIGSPKELLSEAREAWLDIMESGMFYDPTAIEESQYVVMACVEMFNKEVFTLDGFMSILRLVQIDVTKEETCI